MKKIILGVVVLLLGIGLNAQFTYNYLQAADNYFGKGDYNSAASYYEKYLADGKGKQATNQYNPYTVQSSSKKSARTVLSSKEQALYNLAECYRFLNYPAKAEPHYKMIVENNAVGFPLASYHYASVLRALGKFPEAESFFQTFLTSYTQEDAFKETARREIKNLQFIQQQLKRRDLSLFAVRRSVDAAAVGASYAPVWTGANSLLFTSTRPDSSATEKTLHTNRLYQGTMSNGNLAEVAITPLPQLAGTHQGAVSLSPDGQTLYFTRWETQSGKKSASIFISKKSGETWGEASPANGINLDGANTQQPFMMPDGKHLLFSSDRPGGLGGFDLYVAKLDAAGNPVDAQNLGPVINTKFDEQAPYYHAPSEQLVFSSNGRIGMGGYDFFLSKGSPGNWAEPVNAGYPVNSIKDDMYFTSRSDAKNILGDVMISSDREAACCLELFTLRKSFTVKSISGQVISCEGKQPLAGAQVRIIDPRTNNTLVTRTTAADGSYTFTLDEFQPLVAVATADGFEEGKISFEGPADELVTTLKNPALCLEAVFPPPVGTIEEIPNIYFDYDSASIKEESFVYLDALAEKMIRKPNAVLEIGGHTDGKGEEKYNQRLSEARAQAVVTYLIAKGVKQEQLQAKGYGESMPVAPNENADGTDNEEGRAKNRRTEFKVLQR